ncbi:MAG: cupin domain-containing protein [Bdellovibrionaceae bacterium]|nr:cupin domain-containing protein [Bdellovibrionales bacterium]MCB9086083.1 cupin domain-containing protein [Pseudobdellovibrionaceae bacterium]
MIVTRWQAPLVPDKNQIHMMFVAEGLEPFEESFDPGTNIANHRHPFDEVRMVASGQLVIDVAGNKMLLRAGDKIVIPSNTRHSKKVEGTEPCVCICASKSY